MLKKSFLIILKVNNATFICYAKHVFLKSSNNAAHTNACNPSMIINHITIREMESIILSNACFWIK